jgi:spermidine synthase
VAIIDAGPLNRRRFSREENAIMSDSLICGNEADLLLEEYTYPTMFGDAEVFCLETDDGVPVRALYVAGGFQSATYLGDRRFEPVFAYCRAIDRAFDMRPVRRMLMIGGGAFSYPKHLLTSDDVRLQAASIDVVEIDPAIVDVARRHFFLDEVERLHGPAGTARLGIIVGDGVEAVRAAAPSTYDVVVNDSFDGTNPTSGLLAPETLQATKCAMTDGGLYLVNAVSETIGDIEAFVWTLHEVFVHVYLLRCPDEDFDGSENNLIIASDAPADLPDLLVL